MSDEQPLSMSKEQRKQRILKPNCYKFRKRCHRPPLSPFLFEQAVVPWQHKIMELALPRCSPGPCAVSEPFQVTSLAKHCIFPYILLSAGVAQRRNDTDGQAGGGWDHAPKSASNTRGTRQRAPDHTAQGFILRHVGQECAVCGD